MGIVVLFFKEQIRCQNHHSGHQKQIGAQLEQSGHQAIHRFRAT